MPVLTFDDVKVKQKKPKEITFEDISKKSSSGVVTFDNLKSAKPKVEETISTFSPLESAIGKAKRVGLSIARGALEDIPFVRKVLPKEQKWEKQGLTGGEKTIKGVTPFVRDVGLYTVGAGLVGKLAQMSKIAKAGQVVSKIPKVGGLVAKTIPEIAKGAILGATTAGAEEPEKIVKKAGQYGAFVGAMPTVMKGIGLAGKGIARITPQPIKKSFVEFGKSIGVVLNDNKVINLIRKRYSDIQKGYLKTGQFVDELKKTLTPNERKLIPFLRQRAIPKEIRQQILRNPEIRKRYYSHIKPVVEKTGDYLDDSHKFLMENYGDDIGFIKNYIPQMWDIPKNKERAVINWFVTRNPHLKKRLIPTLKEGMEKFGLKPKYDDITDIVKVYDAYKFNAVANLNFAQDLKKIKDSTGIQMLQRVNKAPTDWKMIDHPALRRAMGYFVGKDEMKKLMLSKQPIKVHPEIYDSVKAVFGQPLTNEAMKNFEAINYTAKYLNLTLSLFHHTAISETGIASGIGKETMKAWNPIRIIKAFKSGKEKTIFKDIELSKRAVEAGVGLGRVIDVEGGNMIIKTLTNAEKTLRATKGNLVKRGLAKVGIGATKIRKAAEYNDRFLWSYLHPTFKLTAFNKLSADMVKKNLGIPTKAVEREVAQWVNDSFGGQVWELLGKSKGWQQFAHTLILSPDWVLSTLRQALAPLGIGATSATTRAIRAELGQDFWRKAIVYFGGGMNILNYSMTKAHIGKGRFMWDNAPGKKTHLFIGYNSDGTEAYIRWGKQFKELPEFIINPVEVVSRKKSPIARMIQSQVFPHPTWQEEFAGKPFWKLGALKGRTKELGKGFLPYSISQQIKGGFNPLAFAMPISKGMTPFKTRELFQDAIKRKDKNRIREIWSAALNNNLDAKTLFIQSRSSIKSDITFDFKKDAYKTIERLRKLGKEKGRAAYEKMKQKGEITSEIEKQFLKILKQQKSIKEQKERLPK